VRSASAAGRSTGARLLRGRARGRGAWGLVLGLAGIALLLAPRAPADELGLRPGTYRGYVRRDRWGQKLLQHGRRAWLLTDEVYLWLEPGQPMVLQVADIRRPDRSAPSRIDAVYAAAVERLPLALGLTLRFDPRRQTTGETLLATVAIRNLAAAPLDVYRKKLRLSLLRRSWLGVSYPEEELLGASEEAPDLGRAVRAVPRREAGEPTILVREIPLEWRNASSVGRLEPGVTLRQTFAFGEDLPTGEYEAFAVWGERDDPAARQPMSEVRSFDLNAP